MLETFTFEAQTRIHYSCPTVLKGKMLIFGGIEGFKRQWSSVESCSVRVAGKLDFDFTNGACNTIKIESIISFFHFLKENINPISSTTSF